MKCYANLFVNRLRHMGASLLPEPSKIEALSSSRQPIDTQTSLRFYQILSCAVGFGLVLGVRGWAALASMDGAVSASGLMAVGSFAKKSQRREGGIVAEIRVQEGDTVQAGDILLVLSDA